MKLRLHILFSLTLFGNVAFTKANSGNTDHTIISTNLMSMVYRSEFGVEFEYLMGKKNLGLSLGGTFHSRHNFIVSLANGAYYSSTQTNGGAYQLDRMNSPLYLYDHSGYTAYFLLKRYFRNFSQYVGTQLLVGYREGLGGYYTDHDFVPMQTSYADEYYWYSANHYSKRIGLTINAGLTPKHRRSLLRSDFGGQIGLNICSDKIELLSWGHKAKNPDIEFTNNFPSMRKAKHTDGFYVAMAFRIYYKVNFDLNYKRKYGKI